MDQQHSVESPPIIPGQGAADLLANMNINAPGVGQSPTASPEPRRESAETHDSVTQDCSGSNPLSEEEEGASRQGLGNPMEISRQPADAMSQGRMSDTEAAGRGKHRRKGQPNRAPGSIERPSTPLFSLSSPPSPAGSPSEQAAAGDNPKYQLRNRNLNFPRNASQAGQAATLAEAEAALQPGKAQRSRLAVLQPPGGRSEPYLCPDCGTSQTPMWRWVNDRLFCNACALRLKRDIKLAAMARASSAAGGKHLKGPSSSRNASGDVQQRRRAKRLGRLPEVKVEGMGPTRRGRTPTGQTLNPNPAPQQPLRAKRCRGHRRSVDSEMPQAKIPRNTRSARRRALAAAPQLQSAEPHLRTSEPSPSPGLSERSVGDGGSSPCETSSPTSDAHTGAWHRDPWPQRRRHIIVRAPHFPDRPSYEAQGEYASLSKTFCPGHTGSPMLTSSASPFAWAAGPFQVPVRPPRPAQPPAALPPRGIRLSSFPTQALPVGWPLASLPVRPDNLAASADRLLQEPGAADESRSPMSKSGGESVSFRALLTVPLPGEGGASAYSLSMSSPSSLPWPSQEGGVGEGATAPFYPHYSTLATPLWPASPSQPLPTQIVNNFPTAATHPLSPDPNRFNALLAITDTLPCAPWGRGSPHGPDESVPARPPSPGFLPQCGGGLIDQRSMQAMSNGRASQGSWEVRNAQGESQLMRSRRIDGAGVRWAVRKPRSGVLR